jgi:diguanylate cyclase (GGDEF)-like protein
MVLLGIAVLFFIGGIIFIPIDVYDASDSNSSIELTPTKTESIDDNVRVFYFDNVDWLENGNCLHFVSSHQEINVEADGETIFERNSVSTIWGNTPGFTWEYIEVPTETTELTVTVKACYASQQNIDMFFYQGHGIQMFKQAFKEQFFTGIISFINVCVGFILIIYGILAKKRSNIGDAMIYLGIFTVLLGLWSISENGIMAVLMENRAANSFLSFTSLSLIGIPFVMFVRCYLQTEDKYVYKAVLALNVTNIILIYQLQFLGILDMKETLSMTHVSMLASVLYLPFSLICMIVKKNITRRFWVTVWSLCSMVPPLMYSLYLYYYGSHNVDSYGNIFVFVFIAFFAVDVTLTTIKDVDAGKKAAVYQELAEKDMLTGCYNRNAYRNDTNTWIDLPNVLLVTCDLNNLKQCNDTLGHAYGDKYITDAATILTKLFAKHGRIYRIGGDEFCILIKDKKSCHIEKIMRELREEERVYNAHSEVITLQIACGYSEYDSEKDMNIEDIRNRADELMYQNKKELKKVRFFKTPKTDSNMLSD